MDSGKTDKKRRRAEGEKNTVAAAATGRISEHSLALLAEELKTINLLFARNKNQHRVALWWKHFSLLRANVRRILVAGGRAGENGDGRSRSRKRKQNSGETSVREALDRREEMQKTAERFRENNVPAMFVAFSTVVADKQFSQLGAVLMGILARVWMLVGGMGEMGGMGGTEEGEEGDAGIRIERVEVGGDGDGDEDVDEGADMEIAVEPDRKESKGKGKRAEIVSIDDIFGDDFDDEEEKEEEKEDVNLEFFEAQSSQAKRPRTSIAGEQDKMKTKMKKEKKKKKKKKKKKAKSSIDDIFSGLM